MEMENDYTGIASPEVVELVRQRAKRFGLYGDDLQDAEQEVMIAIDAFTYEPERSNGACEMTALHALIDNKLKCIVRCHIRYGRRKDAYRVAWGLPDPETDGPPSVDGEYEIMNVDVRMGMERLDPEARFVCRGIMKGWEKSLIAAEAGFSINKLNRILRDIEADFRATGLHQWIEG